MSTEYGRTLNNDISSFKAGDILVMDIETGIELEDSYGVPSYLVGIFTGLTNTYMGDVSMQCNMVLAFDPEGSFVSGTVHTHYFDSYKLLTLEQGKRFVKEYRKQIITRAAGLESEMSAISKRLKRYQDALEKIEKLELEPEIQFEDAGWLDAGDYLSKH